MNISEMYAQVSEAVWNATVVAGISLTMRSLKSGRQMQTGIPIITKRERRSIGNNRFGNQEVARCRGLNCGQVGRG